jgi:hypothetical protein
MSPKTKKVSRKKTGKMPEKKAPKSPSRSKLKGEVDDKDLDQIAGGLANNPSRIKLY